MKTNDVTKQLYAAAVEVSHFGLYCNKLTTSDLQKIPAENIAESSYRLWMLAEAFADNDLKEFFTEVAHPEEAAKYMLEAATVYKKALAGLLLSDRGEDYPAGVKTNDYIGLIYELSDLCQEIDKLSTDDVDHLKFLEPPFGGFKMNKKI